MRLKKRTGGKSRTEREDYESKQKYRFAKRRISQINAEMTGINVRVRVEYVSWRYVSSRYLP